MDKGIVYYTDNCLEIGIAETARAQIAACRNGYDLVSVSLNAPLSFGNNLVFEGERGPLTMLRQILAGLETSKAEIVFFCEHDVLYHPSHFDFWPLDPSIVYYNTNVWQVRALDGKAVTYIARRLSQLCAYRELLLGHYRRKIAEVEQRGFDRHYEPGSRGHRQSGDGLVSEHWNSAFPNIDIKHESNLVYAKWSPSEFRDPLTCQGWMESDCTPGWGKTEGCFGELLQKVKAQKAANG